MWVIRDLDMIYLTRSRSKVTEESRGREGGRKEGRREGKKDLVLDIMLCYVCLLREEGGRKLAFSLSR